jgi:hypothetical protein
MARSDKGRVAKKRPTETSSPLFPPFSFFPFILLDLKRADQAELTQSELSESKGAEPSQPSSETDRANQSRSIEAEH